MNYDLNHRTFRGKENYSDGDFDESVLFRFSQNGDVVKATFEGRQIVQGVLLGVMVDGGRLSGHWIYLNDRHEPVLGVFESVVESSVEGRLILKEHWASLSPGAPKLGFSAIEET
jgi:hypothetical protein